MSEELGKTANQSPSLPERIGQRLGSIVIFLLCHQRRSVRWIKRAAVAGVLGAFVLSHQVELAKTLATMGMLIVLGLVFAKSWPSRASSHEDNFELSRNPNIPRNGFAGFGYYDSHGNFRGSSDPSD